MPWKDTLVNLIIQMIAGAIGGTAAGSALKDLSMGKAGDAISGAVGGGVVGQILMAVLGGAAAPERRPRGRIGYWRHRQGPGRRRRWRRGGDGHRRRLRNAMAKIAKVRRSVSSGFIPPRRRAEARLAGLVALLAQARVPGLPALERPRDLSSAASGISRLCGPISSSVGLCGRFDVCATTLRATCRAFAQARSAGRADRRRWRAPSGAGA